LIGFAVFRVDLDFGDQFEGGAEVVLPEAPGLIKVIDRRYEFGFIQTVVAEQLSDMRPVFLFDAGVVIFVVRSDAAEANGPAAFCRSGDRKGERPFDCFDLGYHSRSATISGRSILRPTGIDSGQSKTPNEASFHRVRLAGPCRLPDNRPYPCS
jgi:hypothetical protein